MHRSQLLILALLTALPVVSAAQDGAPDETGAVEAPANDAIDAEGAEDAARDEDAPTAPAAPGAPPDARAARRALLCPPPLPSRVPLLARPPDTGETRAVSDHAVSDRQTTELSGDVEVRQRRSLIAGDHVRLERERDWAEARGNVYLETGELELDGDEAEFELDTQLFEARRTHYRETEIPAQGRARRIVRESETFTRLENATFSTCPFDQEDWTLRAWRVQLDTETNQGRALHSTLWFKGVPLLYSPLFQFPLSSDRQSGFLAPSFGFTSSSGTTIATPYYLNLAPNYDATITPRYLRDRGTQTATELRWLNRQGFWQVEHEHVNDELFGDRRNLSHLRHQGRLGQRWRTSADLTRVSDSEYFDDLTTDLSVNRRSHLRRRADASWSDNRTDFMVRVQNFQTLNENISPQNRPYEQRPRVTLSSGERFGMVTTGFDSEVVNYTRRASDETVRTRLVPTAGVPMETPGWFLRPRISVDHTEYDIDRVTSEGDERISRTVPIASVDGGLVFERWSDRYRQTLEPRAFYLKVPHVEQDDIPIFDSSERGFSFSQMFRERRFAGGDRVGDADQLSLALSSRVFERRTGREVFRIGGGAIRHFADREVQLPSQPVAERNTSDYLGEVYYSPHPYWRGDTTVQWDPEEELVRRAAANVGFRGPAGGEARLGWRFRHEQQELINAAFTWPISPRWRLLGRGSYSIFDEQYLESLAGLEYSSCCWTLRSVVRQYVSDDGGELSEQYFIELVLDGLGGLGETGELAFD